MNNFILITLVALLLGACAPVVKEEPVVVQEVSREPEPEAVDIQPEKEPRQGVIILMSSTASSYQVLAKKIAAQLEDEVTTLSMSSSQLHNKTLLEDIRSSDKELVVALGLRAARLLTRLNDKPVIFSQVINYNDYDLVSVNMKGVSALPSPEQLFRDWRAISPGITKIAVVSGKNLDHFLERARRAARTQGIELITRQVKTDKEFIYTSKNMPLDIQGQWIVPDNRVLSSKALKEVMAYASRRGRQIVVFSPSLLSFGGLMFVSPDDDYVSSEIVKRLDDCRLEDEIPGADIVPVLQHELGINGKIARQLNLRIPGAYRDQIYEQ